jgi:hypothetical protein
MIESIVVTRYLGANGKWVYGGKFKGVHISGRKSADELWLGFEGCALLHNQAVARKDEYLPFNTPEFHEWAVCHA